jgi:hypothetical protein
MLMTALSVVNGLMEMPFITRPLLTITDKAEDTFYFPKYGIMIGSQRDAINRVGNFRLVYSAHSFCVLWVS